MRRTNKRRTNKRKTIRHKKISYKQKAGSQEFINLCSNGDLEGAQEYFRLNPRTNISAFNNFAFSEACSHGHLDVAQWLLQINPNIIFSVYKIQIAFQGACSNGHLHVAQSLLQASKENGQEINISAFGDYAFRFACHNRHLDVAKWLATLNPKYEITDENSPDWRCRILTDPKDIKRNKNKKLLWLASQKGNIVEKMPTDLVRITGSYL